MRECLTRPYSALISFISQPNRDIKPENILLVSKDDDVSLKIADFGFAVRLNGSAGVKQQAGTPGYVSPEVIERKTHGKPVDMWAMGVVLFMLLGGYPPFYEADGNTKNMYRRIIVGDYHFHPDYWCDVSDEAKDLVRGLLTVDPAKRLTVEQALEHPWVQKPRDQFSLVPLAKASMALREWRANRATFAKAATTATVEAVRKLSSVNLATSVAGLSSGGNNVLQEVAIDVMRKLSNTNLNADVIEAARKKSGTGFSASGGSSARRGSHNAGVPGATPGSVRR